MNTSTKQAGNSRSEPYFWGLVLIGVIGIMALQPFPVAAGLLGFAMAARSAIGNDSMQTLGTFIASNRKVPWWVLGAFISVVLITVHLVGWFSEGREIHFGRLDKIALPETITHLQLLAPLVLLILTRYGVPVSTTFLLISVFSEKSMRGMLVQSIFGYVLALAVAFGCWYLLHRYKLPLVQDKHYNRARWRAVQWLSTTFLWATWLMHDTANIAVFLPRQLSASYLITALVIMTSVVFMVMRSRGGEVQVIIEEKSDTDDIRAATLVDVVYAVVLLYFKEHTKLPMSTTWVFLGLLAGRQFAIRLAAQPTQGSLCQDLRLARKDLIKATIGILVSVALVLIGNALH